MGGELPAIVIVESVSRLIPGVIGRKDFLSEKIIKKQSDIAGFPEYPQYTRPEILDFQKITNKRFLKKYGNIEIKNKKIKNLSRVKWKVPQDLLSGNHAKIEEYRKKRTKLIWK